MSTHAIIARGTPTKFSGRYHHYDGCPTGLGAALWEHWRGHFGGTSEGLRAMLGVLIDDHPAGWRSIVGRDFALPVGAVSREVERRRSARDEATREPECYCHGARREGAALWTEATPASWAYVFDARAARAVAPSSGVHLRVLSFDGRAGWVLRGTVKCDQDMGAPDWELIECDAPPRTDPAAKIAAVIQPIDVAEKEPTPCT